MVKKLIFAIALLCIPVYSQLLSLKDSLNLVQRQLDSTQQKIQELETNLNNIALQEQKCLERLELLQQKISLTQKMLRQISVQIEHYNREIIELNNELVQILERQKSCQNRLRLRLLAIYKYSKIYQLQAFLTSTNLPEYYQRMIKLRVISRSDRQLLDDLRRINSEIKIKEQQIQAAITGQEKLKSEYEVRNMSLLKDREQESSILLQIRQRKETQNALRQELQTISSKLKNLLVELQKRMISAHFGIIIHPRYRTKINNTGIDIKVKESSPVKVVADGKIAYADRFVGYGNLVIVDHGNGYFTLYGNLSSINTTVNAFVATGTAIGTVDDFLHFELRKDGQPLNPEDWLQ
jgi:septal ring factor EnvC (AmiA/AmiB activator)